jgi:tripartite-type tricarboxylate transporter receptor subunit TctC
MSMRRRALLAAPILVPALTQAQAQPAWPSRPIRFLLPDPPGSGNDVIARLVGPHLQAALGQPVVMDNRPGAGGRIGVEAAFRAPADGYTFLVGNAGSNGINAAIYRDLPYDLEADFDPVSLLALGPNVLVVNPRSIPVRNVRELIAELRRRPGEVNFAMTAPGASGHMMTELFRVMTGVDIVLVPYRGAPDMARAVIAGESPVNFNNLSNIAGPVQAGEVAVLAVTTRERSPLLPEAPTMEESGLPGFEAAAWTALFARRGTPAPVIARVQTELAALRTNAELRARFRAAGTDLVMSDGEALRARISADVARWRDVAARADIRAQ